MPPKLRSGGDVVALGEQRDPGEEEDPDQVQRARTPPPAESSPDPPAPGSRRGTRPAPPASPPRAATVIGSGPWTRCTTAAAANSNVAIPQARRLPRLSPRATAISPSPIATEAINPADRPPAAMKPRCPSENRIARRRRQQRQQPDQDAQPSQRPQRPRSPRRRLGRRRGSLRTFCGGGAARSGRQPLGADRRGTE